MLNTCGSIPPQTDENSIRRLDTLEFQLVSDFLSTGPF